MEKPTRLALLKEIAEYLNEETELYDMMHGALNYLIKGSNFTTGWIFFIDDDGEHEIVADVDLPGALKRNHCRYMKEGSCWCVTAYHHGRLTTASNIINCSRINIANQTYKAETEGVTHHATVPLRSGAEQYGLLNVASPYTTHYSEEDLALLESVALQIGSAIKRIYLTDQEKEAARINERNRLARDLHDSVNQLLFSLKLTAHAAHDITTDEMAKKAFKTIEETSQSAVNEMRSLIWQLKPVGLEHGLVHALKQYAQILNMDVTIDVDGLIDLSNIIEEHVYRILQECINNTKKHAQTNAIHIILKQEKERLMICVEDEGVGFDMNKEINKSSQGLRNINQRIYALNGQFKIDSKLNKGTTLRFSIPL
ncbi:GAF domain-containing sensor histidine kinase [Staphylococcus borealis]|uniref:GAF domain-containing sensor histidine kinase n=1 Tax=Staphylococcus borealis TaxID=2742203 RepID=UPI000FEDF642|nr:GAF domain-containing sensor histidine kinase [Staphylococcus borealis]MDM7864362.1 GAF domain-containing sensor histidine kinase [Staphylococcus borealis]MDM7883288.1 GAF domain-containing sensor histidine kinase [Staphylococcus borealis]MDY4022096.1 GAF domain-containing sensor histidine kinase [Staphylococcus borealis]RIO88546.1 GAF domain-containing protein [Staphylococcus haemolyticus]